MKDPMRNSRGKKGRRLVWLGILGLFALIEFRSLGLVRRTFVFYSDIGKQVEVEDRMLRRAESPETDIRRYVEEALLGPVSPHLAPLFSRETRLCSLLYRGVTVYANLSETAALPPVEGRDALQNLFTLKEGVLRNFSFVRKVKIFVEGREVFF
jgi:hypothetical protein